MKELLTTGWLGRTQKYFDELDSTNLYLKTHAHELAHGAAVIAGRQTQGRGRLGRTWQGCGETLALSVLLHDVDLAKMAALPLAAGIAVRSALEGICGAGLGLKWSNDVLYGDKKLCGILCESRLSDGRTFVVVGIGVNLTAKREDFDRLGLVYATSLELATGKNFGNFEIAAKILNEFEPIFEKFQKNGFKGIRESYKRCCVTLGRDVRVIFDNREQNGKAVDIGEDGSLVCEINGEIVAINAGEASVRGIYGYA